MVAERNIFPIIGAPPFYIINGKNAPLRGEMRQYHSTNFEKELIAPRSGK